MKIDNPIVSGSLIVSGSTIITGILSASSFIGDGSGLVGVTSYTNTDTLNYINTLGVVSGSSQISFTDIVNKPTLVSGSQQISFTGITNKPTLVSGSSQVDLTQTTNYVSGIKTRLNSENVVSGSVTWDTLSGKPSGIVSGSGQISALGFTTCTGTVTSIATNDGLTGGTITTTGTIGLTGQALALHNLATNGVIARTGAGTVAGRTITGTANQVTVTNGDGVAGNPTLSLPQSIHTGANFQINSLGVGTAASATTGQIRATNDITGYYSSDIRLKENIKPIESALIKVRQLKGVTFDWNDTYITKNGGIDGYFIKKHDIGVIAQDVEKILPEIVADREDGYKGVKYEMLTPLLIEAIKELYDEIEFLKNNI